MAHVVQLDGRYFPNVSESVAIAEPSPTRQLQWRFAEVSTLEEASELLDWLENHSISQRECQFMENGTFRVSWFG